MAAIDEDIEVPVFGGKLFFRNPDRRAMLVISNFGKGADGQPVPDDRAEELEDQIWEHLVGVEGLSYRNGEPLTVERIRSHEYPVAFFANARDGFFKALGKAINRESADAKNG